MRKMYTVFCDGKIWENIVDDMHTTAIWAMGGMIWDSKKKCHAFITNCRRYNDWKDSEFEIKELIVNKSPLG